jgi:hypothetical protein
LGSERVIFSYNQKQGKTMTRKDFELVAECVAEVVDGYASMETGGTMARMGVHDVALTLANRFEEVNPRFDRNRFLVACGVR